MAAPEFGPTLTRGADKTGGEALIKSQRHQRGFAVTRVSMNRHLLSIYFVIRVQVIENTTGAPSPGTQSAPIVKFARLATVTQPNNAAHQTITGIGLHRDRKVFDKAPTGCEQLMLPALSLGTQ